MLRGPALALTPMPQVLDPRNLPPGCSHLPEPSARSVFVDLLLGLEYLHSNGILHRDLKPARRSPSSASRRAVAPSLPRHAVAHPPPKPACRGAPTHGSPLPLCAGEHGVRDAAAAGLALVAGDAAASAGQAGRLRRRHDQRRLGDRGRGLRARRRRRVAAAAAAEPRPVGQGLLQGELRRRDAAPSPRRLRARAR